jgi:hypothetical protein
MLDKILACGAILASALMMIGLLILFVYVAPYVLVGLTFAALGSFVFVLALAGLLWGLHGLGAL